MKILLDARLYGLEHRGIGRYLINLVKELQNVDKKNNYVILLRKKYFDTLNLSKNWEKVLVDVSHYSFKEQIVLPGVIKKQKADLVHFPHFNIPLFWKGKFIATIHDMTMHRRGRNASKLTFFPYYSKRLLYKLIFKKAVKKSRKVIVPSEAVRKELSNYFNVSKDKFVVSYEGVGSFPEGDEEILNKYSLKKRKYFFYVGGTFPHKNLKLAAKAVKKFNERNKKNVSLAVSSSTNYFLRDLKKEKVKLLGFVPDSELGALYKNSIAFIYPSLSEGFGLQGLEAMKMETLVIASNLPIFKEIYEDNAIYFDPKRVDSISTAMEKVVSLDKQEKTEKIKKAKEYTIKYSWENMAKTTLLAYNAM